MDVDQVRIHHCLKVGQCYVLMYLGLEVEFYLQSFLGLDGRRKVCEVTDLSKSLYLYDSGFRIFTAKIKRVSVVLLLTARARRDL